MTTTTPGHSDPATGAGSGGGGGMGGGWRPEHPGRRPAGVTPGRIVAAIALSAAAGLVLGLLALPTMSLVGITAKTSADDFMDLPTNLEIPPNPQASRMVDAKGRTIAYLSGPEDRTDVKLSQVAPVMRQAIIDIEDSRFYTHHGLDFKGLTRAFFANRENGEVTQGGSTLTQQYVKNVLLEAASTKQERKEATEQTARRKLREARYALYLEQHLSKDKILENYLNIAYFGDGAYGIQAAARHYFSVPASKLNLPQAAMLAGLVKNPTSFNPALHPKAGRLRRDTVLDRMHELHHLSDARWKATKAAPVALKRPKSSVDSCVGSQAPFFCAYVRQTLLADRNFGPTLQSRQKLLFEGGLTIRTSVDLVAQRATDRAATSVLPTGNKIAAAVAMVQPGTGNVLALSINREYGAADDGRPPQTTTDSLHTKQLVPLVPDAFSPGSTFKVFTLTAAIEQGIPLKTTFMAPPCYHSGVFNNPDGGCSTPQGPGYANAEEGEGGVFSLTTATWNSVNTYFIQLEEKVGVKKVAAMARRLGVSSYLLADDKVGSKDGSLTLGSFNASTLDMATAYATLAAHGVRCDPRPVLSITHKVGTTDRPLPFTGPGTCRQVVSRKVADKVSSVLEGVITHGTGTAAAVGRPAAGKTGTAEDFSDAWFVGYIPQLAVAVTVGDPRGPNRYKLGDEVGHANAYGGVMPAQIFSASVRNTINALNLPLAPMPPPDNTQPQKAKVSLPDVRGVPYQVARYVVGAAGFKVKFVAVQSGQPRGIVVAESPDPGGDVPAGTEVRLGVSRGPTRASNPVLPGGGGLGGGPGGGGLGGTGPGNGNGNGVGNGNGTGITFPVPLPGQGATPVR